MTYNPAAATMMDSAAIPRMPYSRFRSSINGNTQYALARDGRFLRVQRVEPEMPVTRIEIVLNWFEKLRLER